MNGAPLACQALPVRQAHRHLADQGIEHGALELGQRRALQLDGRPAIVDQHLGPEADGIQAEELGEIARRESRRLHPFLRDQRALVGIGRAWSNEILNRAKLSPYALTTDLSDEEIERLAATIRELMAHGLELRLAGAGDAKAYKVHNRLGEPCPNCGTPIARVDFEEHTIFYCPECQTGGRVLKDRRLSRLLR
jgi:formamidopyrimidine-DNA glycosylase